MTQTTYRPLEAGAPSTDGFTYLRAPRVIDGRGAEPLRDGAVLLAGSRIVAVGPAREVQPPAGAPVETFDYPAATILPGLIDTHVHLNGFGDGRAGDDLATLPDAILLLQAARNARRHLESGVTTLRECGAKGRTTFDLRAAIALGVTPGPRLVLCGRPVTITGGHLWYFGEEANGVDGVRLAVRRLVKEGADFIKIVATGGSTRTSYPTRAAFVPEEIRALVDEAHRFGKPVAAHCSGTEGIISALDAGMGEGDTIIHCVFREPDGSTQFRPDVARRLAAQGVWVDLTLAQGAARFRHRAAGSTGRTGREGDGAAVQAELPVQPEQPIQPERAAFDKARTVRMDHFRRLLDAGVKMVSGSDSSWGWYPCGEFQYEVIDHSEGGMGNMDALLTATRDAAACLGVARETGTLEAGKIADVLVVDGDPLADIHALLRVQDVFSAGRRVPRP